MYNLTGVEVLALHYLAYQSTDYRLDQQFWKYNYSVKTDNVITKLVREDYIYEGYDAEKSLTNLTVKELKDILRENNLKVSGNKAELVERLLDELPKEILIEYAQKVWIPTNKGKEIIEQTEFIKYTHSNLNNTVSVNSVYKNYLENTSRTDLEVLVSSVESSAEFTGKTERYFPISHTLFSISQIHREYDDFEGQFDYLVRAIVSRFIYDDRGLGTNFLLENYDYFYSEYQIYKQYLNDLENLLLSNEKFRSELKNKINKYYNSKTIPHFTPDKIYEIVEAYINKDENKVNRLYRNAFKENGGVNKQKTDYTYMVNVEPEAPADNKKQSVNKNSGAGCLVPFIMFVMLIISLVLI